MSTATVFPVETTRPHASIRRAEAFRIQRSLRAGFLLAADVAALLTASLLAATILHSAATPFLSLSELANLTIPIALFCAIGLYSTRELHPAVELRKVICAVALATIVLSTVERASFALNVQAAIVLGFVFGTACVAGFRIALRALMIRLGLWLTPAVIVGGGPTAQALVEVLEKHKYAGFRPVAILADPLPAHGSFDSRLLVEHLDNAINLREQHGIAHAIIAESDLAPQDRDAITERYSRCFDQITVIPSLPAVGSLSVSALDLGGYLGLEVAGSRPGCLARLSKRCLDLTCASLFALTASPIFALLYLAVRLSSPGPAFYGQKRIGRNGKYFTAWKFRSMVTNADQVLEQHLAQSPELRKEWELTHKLSNDPRVLPVGRFLRKTSLDEIPQLWNVIRGDMSLVGPRPIVDVEVSRYGNVFDYYKMVRPGITGMWQISGRSNTTYPERVRYDEYFVRNWSIWLDLYILFRTIKTVLLREGAV